MRLCLILIALIPLVSTAQADSLPTDSSAEKKHICFSIKTDVLSWMNTITEPGFTEYSICSAFSFNRQYGLQMRFSYFNHAPNLTMNFHLQYVYFIKIYENSMLNAGAFCGVTTNKYSDEFFKYKDICMQTGISGGGNIRFSKHWHLSPSLLIGVQDLFSRKIEKEFSSNEPERLYLKVLLEIGYRF